MPTNKIHRIGIACIGSGVGQSVINSLRRSSLPLHTIGLGTNPLAFGLYECDEYAYTKSIFDEGYIDDLIRVCLEHRVELIIPGHDDEVLLYAQNVEKFRSAGIIAIHPDEAIVQLCRDKERMSRELNPIAEVFVKSFSPEGISAAIEKGELSYPFIAKPRGGYASRGIEIILGPQDLPNIHIGHIIQELAIPASNDPNHGFYMSQLARNQNPQVSEISIQLVFDLDGKLMGRMCTYHKLSQGIPIEIIPIEDKHVWDVTDRLTSEFLRLGLRGPINLQGRLTDRGLKIFEMNPRFTGITGLRSMMGFNEVEACVKEWLGIDRGFNRLEYSSDRFGIRQTADKSISFARNREAANLRDQINSFAARRKKRVVLTGATGFLGRHIARLIENDNDRFELITLNRDVAHAKSLFGKSAFRHLSYDDLREGRLSIGNSDILLHAAFARPHCSPAEISASLELTSWLFTLAAHSQVPVIINVSSQAVYGFSHEPLWNEETPASPETIYGQAKYASELLLGSLGKLQPHVRYTSIRLCAIEGGSDGFVETGFLPRMIRQALGGFPITVTEPNRRMERLDVHDAAEAIVEILRNTESIQHNVYNIGSGQIHSLKEIAGLVTEIASSASGLPASELLISPKDSAAGSFGLSSVRFHCDFGWKPKRSLAETINSLTHHLQKTPVNG